MRPAPIIEYAHKIGKNTAEFTVKDLVGFMKWWMKQPPRKDLMEATPAQIATYKADVAKVQKYFKEQKMSKTSQYNNAMRSRLGNRNEPSARLTSNQVVDVEQADDSVAMEMSEEMMAEEVVSEETVCSMELTKTDVEALLWAINEIFENYELAGTVHEKSLKDLQEGLSGV